MAGLDKRLGFVAVGGEAAERAHGAAGVHQHDLWAADRDELGVQPRTIGSVLLAHAELQRRWLLSVGRQLRSGVPVLLRVGPGERWWN